MKASACSSWAEVLGCAVPPHQLSLPNACSALPLGAEVKKRGQGCYSCCRAADLGEGNRAPSWVFLSNLFSYAYSTLEVHTGGRGVQWWNLAICMVEV